MIYKIKTKDGKSYYVKDNKQYSIYAKFALSNLSENEAKSVINYIKDRFHLDAAYKIQGSYIFIACSSVTALEYGLYTVFDNYNYINKHIKYQSITLDSKVKDAVSLRKDN